MALKSTRLRARNFDLKDWAKLLMEFLGLMGQNINPLRKTTGLARPNILSYGYYWFVVQELINQGGP